MTVSVQVWFLSEFTIEKSPFGIPNAYLPFYFLAFRFFIAKWQAPACSGEHLFVVFRFFLLSSSRQYVFKIVSCVFSWFNITFMFGVSVDQLPVHLQRDIWVAPKDSWY